MRTRLPFRLSAPVMALSCLPLLVGAAAAWYVYQAQQAASENLAFDVGSIRAAEELAIGFRDVRSLLERYLLTEDVGCLDDALRLRRETDDWLAEARRDAATEREQVLIAEFTDGYESFFRGVSRLKDDTPQAERPAAARALIAQASEVLVPSQEYLDINEEAIQQGSAENRRTAAGTAVGLLLLGVCGPAAGLLAGYGVSRAVHRSVVRLSVPVRDAAGKLNQVVGPVAVASGLSLEGLEALLRRMAGQIGAVVERLQQSQREALRAEQLAAVGQMAAGVAHELRNPLMSMKILVQSAADRDPGGGLAGRDLAVLEEEITRLEQLTTTLLDFARPPQVEKRAFHAQALLEDTVDLVSSRAAQRDVRIDCDLPGEPAWMEADVGQVRQVVFNLLLNALEALQEGGSVRLRLEAAGRWVVIRVADTGPGLPAELGREIFTPFVSTKPTGIGLGLSICKRIAEAHGGEITAADRPGGGAVFTVRLPCACGRAGSRRVG
jgi:two-component system, NtrC family, sensor histidine kinase HydH